MQSSTDTYLADCLMASQANLYGLPVCQGFIKTRLRSNLCNKLFDFI